MDIENAIAQTAAQAEVERAIARSISHNEIVTIRGGEHQYAALITTCDGHVDTGDGREEFWGTDDAGSEWRVHMRRH